MSDSERSSNRIKGWLHTTEDYGDGNRETWYSPSKDTSASRGKDWIEYRHHSAGVYHSFDVNEGLLYRVPEHMPSRPTHYLQTIETLAQIVQDNEPPSDVLEKLGFMRGGAGTELVSQSLEKIDEGQRLLEYRIAVRHGNDLAECRFRMDRETQLVRRADGTAKVNGKQQTWETRFDYPESGPADIYDLGVPRSTRIVDRILPPNMQDIVDTVSSGRQSMDDYRAIVTERMPDSDSIWWRGEQTMIIYRKGDKFRVDTAHWFDGLIDYCMVDKPGDDIDMEAWWRQRVSVFVYCPFYINSDSMRHHVKLQLATDPQGGECWKVESIDSRKQCGKPGHVFPPYYSRTPEFACRPPMGIPNQNMEPVLHPSPTNGPSGTILLEVRVCVPMPTCSGIVHGEGLPPQPNVFRYWLDPRRGFPAVRWDMVIVSDSGEEKLLGSTLIEEMAQSPGGTWYAKRMRIRAVPPVQHDEVFDFYLDFDVNLPDSFFEPPKVGDTFK